MAVRISRISDFTELGSNYRRRRERNKKNKHSKFKMERNSKFVLMFNFKHVADVKKRRGIGRPFSISVLCLRAFSLAFTNMILNELLGLASLRRDYCFVVDCEKCSFQTEMEKNCCLIIL